MKQNFTYGLVKLVGSDMTPATEWTSSTPLSLSGFFVVVVVVFLPGQILCRSIEYPVCPDTIIPRRLQQENAGVGDMGV